jgi:hypothetical protein
VVGTWSHVAYADESNWNVGRYRSVATVTVLGSEHDRIVDRIRGLLDESSVVELSWKDLKGAKERLGAVKIVDVIIEEACVANLRVDVLMWDMEDARHAGVRGRDDVANLGRMYHHLFVNVLRSKWPNGSTWSMHPDEHSQVDWETLQKTVEAKGGDRVEGPTIEAVGDLTEFRVVQLVPRESHGHPLIQVADLFAGIMPYSHAKFDEFERWLPSSAEQAAPPDTKEPSDRLSGSDAELFVVLRDLKQACSDRKLYVSLERSRGLRTMKPKGPINFWIYEPQSEQDRAPTKQRWPWSRRSRA